MLELLLIVNHTISRKELKYHYCFAQSLQYKRYDLMAYKWLFEQFRQYLNFASVNDEWKFNRCVYVKCFSTDVITNDIFS